MKICPLIKIVFCYHAIAVMFRTVLGEFMKRGFDGTRHFIEIVYQAKAFRERASNVGELRSVQFNKF